MSIVIRIRIFNAVGVFPCCINYSRARARGGPRDLVGADMLVQKTIWKSYNIIDHNISGSRITGLACSKQNLSDSTLKTAYIFDF